MIEITDGEEQKREKERNTFFISPTVLINQLIYIKKPQPDKLIVLLKSFGNLKRSPFVLNL